MPLLIDPHLLSVFLLMADQISLQKAHSSHDQQVPAGLEAHLWVAPS